MQSYTVILKDKYPLKYIFISYTLAWNDIKWLDIKTKQPLSGILCGNITLFGVEAEGSGDPLPP